MKQCSMFGREDYVVRNILHATTMDDVARRVHLHVIRKLNTTCMKHWRSRISFVPLAFEFDEKKRLTFENRRDLQVGLYLIHENLDSLLIGAGDCFQVLETNKKHDDTRVSYKVLHIEIHCYSCSPLIFGNKLSKFLERNKHGKPEKKGYLAVPKIMDRLNYLISYEKGTIK